MSKRTVTKTGFSVNQAKHCYNWRGFLHELWFQVGVNLFKRRKLVPKSARSQSWLCPFNQLEGRCKWWPHSQRGIPTSFICALDKIANHNYPASRLTFEPRARAAKSKSDRAERSLVKRRLMASPLYFAVAGTLLALVPTCACVPTCASSRANHGRKY